VTIVVAGGGIAGLGAAIAARRAGHDVQVLEQASGPAEVGAGLALWPNGLAALARLGVDVPGCPVRRLQLLSWRGRTLTELPIGDLRSRHGYELMLVHRPELHASLLAAAGRDVVRYGARVAGFDLQEPDVRVRLSSGEALRADLLVGADGIGSAVRTTLLQDGDPRPAGATCWRGVTTFDSEEAVAWNWWGRGGEFGLFPLPEGRAYWFGVQNRPAHEGDSPAGRKADVLQAFASWPPVVRSVVEATDPRAILRNDLSDRPPARRWSRGRVVLAGDAAHPMLPNVAQGACQALEDAVVLGDALAVHSIEEALRVYETARVGAANRLIRQARQGSRMVQATNPALTAARDLAVAHLPRRLLLRQVDSMGAASARKRFAPGA
jgi:2-polyprenyl-6-methoxyphenol hydroxylase-like FAD-dependent oxidoreductase